MKIIAIWTICIIILICILFMIQKSQFRRIIINNKPLMNESESIISNKEYDDLHTIFFDEDVCRLRHSLINLLNFFLLYADYKVRSQDLFENLFDIIYSDIDDSDDPDNYLSIFITKTHKLINFTQDKNTTKKRIIIHGTHPIKSIESIVDGIEQHCIIPNTTDEFFKWIIDIFLFFQQLAVHQPNGEVIEFHWLDLCQKMNKTPVRYDYNGTNSEEIKKVLQALLGGYISELSILNEIFVQQVTKWLWITQKKEGLEHISLQQAMKDYIDSIKNQFKSVSIV